MLPTPISPTDKAFQDLCITSNDQIMNYSSNTNLFSMDSLDVKKDAASSSNIANVTKNNDSHRINSKLLYEIIHADIDDPMLSLKNGNLVDTKMRSCSESTSARSYEIAARNYEQRILFFKKSHQQKADEFEKQNGKLSEDANTNDDDDVFLEEENNKLIKRRTQSASSSSASDSSERRSASSTSSSSSSSSSFNTQNKKQPNTNVDKSKHLSTATTLEISSYTSDSLFNSHFILTPMYSDTIFSPSTQLGSLLLKSPLLQPNSPAAYRANNSSNNNGQSPHLTSFNFNNCTPHQKKQFFQSSNTNCNDDLINSFTNASKPPYRSPTFNSTSPTTLVKTSTQDAT